MVIRRLIPRLIKSRLEWVYRRFIPSDKYASDIPPDKYASEMEYWESRWKAEGGRFENSHYRKLMLAMAGEDDDTFLSGKVVADFGCGPRGSLVWAESAQERIGIDVLADAYAQHFDLSSQPMRYTNSTEETIPLPTGYVDVLYTLNAMDHVYHFDIMCSELLRVSKPGGDFVGSFNLEEPPTACEPQFLTEQLVKTNLLDHLEVKLYRTAAKGPYVNRYVHFFDGSSPPKTGERLLWVRATKFS